MLTIVIPGGEYYDEVNEEFIYLQDDSINLEHSLLAVSKWESKHKIPFLAKGEKTTQQVLDYIGAMLLSPEISPEVFSRLTPQNLVEIDNYIESSESATTFGEMPQTKTSAETITSELIYYWMVAFNIPFECETWHLNRLFSLIRICNVKNSKPKKMTASQIAERNRALNEERKAKLGTTG